MTRILAIETASEACSAALFVDGEVRERFEIAPRGHAALILPYAQSLLDEAGLALQQLDAIAFGRGPGSFTGLRIAAGMAQGIAFGADLPVVAVSTLAALAQGTLREHGVRQVMAALDARMKEVYWACYRGAEQGMVALMGDECVCDPAQVPLPGVGDRWVGAGSGWAAYGEVLSARCGFPTADVYAQQQPHAADVARLAVRGLEQGEAVAAEQALPVYLRDNVADKPRAKV